jgi:hypothetical protein
LKVDELLPILLTGATCPSSFLAALTVALETRGIMPEYQKDDGISSLGVESAAESARYDLDYYGVCGLVIDENTSLRPEEMRGYEDREL